MARKKILQAIESAVLIASRRRCCFCHGLDLDSSPKEGQIAHLDRHPGNSNEDNLAFMCFAHHNWYDTAQSQGKSPTVSEAKRYRDTLYEYVAEAIRPAESGPIEHLPRHDSAEHDSTVVVPQDPLAGLPGLWRAAIEGFLTHYLGPLEYPAPFGGRRKNLDELDQWIEEDRAPRYALIASRGGVGKSALLAHWVNSLQSRGTKYTLVYHPISPRWQTNSSSAVFTCLAFRLAAVFGEPAPNTQDNEQLREVILGYIEKANREYNPLLIVVDGLDEAAGWEVDTALFPPSRKGNTRILVAARPLGGNGPQEWLNRLGWAQAGIARCFDLDLLDKQGIADVLHRMGNPLAALILVPFQDETNSATLPSWQDLELSMSRWWHPHARWCSKLRTSGSFGRPWRYCCRRS